MNVIHDSQEVIKNAQNMAANELAIDIWMLGAGYSSFLEKWNIR